MSRLAPILIVLVLQTVPAWAWDLNTAAGQHEHCRYLREGTLVRSMERPDYCEPLPPAGHVDLFWTLVIVAGALVAIGYELTRRRV